MKTVYALLAVLALTACGSDKDSPPSPLAGKYAPTGNYCQDLGAGLTCGLNAKPVECAGYKTIDAPSVSINLVVQFMRVEGGENIPLFVRKDGKTAAAPSLLAVYEIYFETNKILVQADHKKLCVQEFAKVQ